MQTDTKTHKATPPKSLTFNAAARYVGVSANTLRNWERKGLVTVYNVIIPGNSRGRRLVDRQSLDDLLAGSEGAATTASICKRKSPPLEIEMMISSDLRSTKSTLTHDTKTK